MEQWLVKQPILRAPGGSMEDACTTEMSVVLPPTHQHHRQGQYSRAQPVMATLFSVSRAVTQKSAQRENLALQFKSWQPAATTRPRCTSSHEWPKEFLSALGGTFASKALLLLSFKALVVITTVDLRGRKRPLWGCGLCLFGLDLARG